MLSLVLPLRPATRTDARQETKGNYRRRILWVREVVSLRGLSKSAADRLPPGSSVDVSGGASPRDRSSCDPARHFLFSLLRSLHGDPCQPQGPESGLARF